MEDQHDTFLSTQLVTDGIHQAFAVIGAVSGVDIDMPRCQTIRTMIATTAGTRRDFATTVHASEGLVNMRKFRKIHGRSRTCLWGICDDKRQIGGVIARPIKFVATFADSIYIAGGSL